MAPSPSLRLALDTSSPVVSVAVSRAGEVVARRTIEQRSSSRELIGTIDACLDEAGTTIAEVDELVALRGPGSFTGLRIGLATVMGFHQALGTRVAAPSTLEVLAWGQPGEARTLALVHALREDWFVQSFAGDPPEPLDEPRRASRAELAGFEPAALVGFGLERLEDTLPGVSRIDSGPLAAIACAIPSDRLAWDASALQRPLYLAAPPVTRAKRPKSVLGDGG